MKKIALPALLVTLLGVAACSALVTVDRSKIKDDLYVPTPGLDAGTDSGTDSGSTEEEDAGDGEDTEDAGVP